MGHIIPADGAGHRWCEHPSLDAHPMEQMLASGQHPQLLAAHELVHADDAALHVRLGNDRGNRRRRRRRRRRRDDVQGTWDFGKQSCNHKPLSVSFAAPPHGSDEEHDSDQDRVVGNGEDAEKDGVGE
ncbi:hypothetical protein OPV22_008147 [Ensete ventricosum]|uniref:Uncharacterized protein n=1 Tax=Ensete ventricosum TaxID=4639 RepID=A0AAV8R823_ENSVE|nr:hypothetical protein OPV22_008147 [Ensete ventricosum]